MKKGKIFSKVALLIVLVYPILFSGCQLLLVAVAHGIDTAQSAADEKSKKFTDANEKDLVITKTGKGAVIKRYRGKNKNIRLPSEIKGMPVIGISDKAFFNKGLINVIIPDSVTTIGESAFAANNLTSVTISNGVTTIGDYAFTKNYISSITIPNSVRVIGFEAFANIFALDQFTSITIPSNVVVRYSTSHFGRFYNLNNRAGGTYRRAESNYNWWKE